VTDIYRRDHAAGNAAVATTFSVGRERCLSKQQEADGERYAE